MLMIISNAKLIFKMKSKFKEFFYQVYIKVRKSGAFYSNKKADLI